jgi:ABC-type transport system involved in Fe-S cluster assembly fused permease/ATPase subunit
MIDDNALSVVVHIPVVIVTLLDHNGIVAIAVVTVADYITVAIAISIAMARSNGHADRANTDSNFIRTGRHRESDSGCCDGYYCQTIDH